MTEVEIRLQCLALAMPKTISDPATPGVLKRAQDFYDFVMLADTPKGPAQASRPILSVADTGNKATRKT